ncbi:MAG: hypothetical protein KF784_00415 [Fimbriimonadaceae bacterium]|nr:hypothetical protein [Fimbriimonadaceae bacterium]
MPGPIYNVGATVICPHGGQVTPVPTSTRVLFSGTPAVLVPDTCTVAGCAFTLPGPKPSPCIRVQWLVGATRVLIEGRPPLIQTSTGLCLSPEQAPQGPPTITVTQMRVIAT